MDDKSGTTQSSLPADARPSQPKVEIKDLERLVEFELKRFDDNQRAYGWTPWGLMVALAALAWNFGDRARSPGDWTAVGLWWAAIVILLEFLTTIRSSVPKATSAVSTHVRYFSTNWIMAGSREFIVVDGFVRAGACLTILAHAQLPSPLNYYWWLPTIASLLALVVGLFAAGGDYPIRFDFERSVFARVMSTVSFGFGLVAAAAAVVVVYRLIMAGIDREAVRTAGILVVATKVLGLLAEHRIAGPFQDRLAELRRSMGLGELSVEAARRSLDETLRGVSPTEHLRRHLGEFEESFARAAAAHVTLQRALETLSGAFASAASDVPPTYVEEAKAAHGGAKVAMKRNTKHAETINSLIFALWMQAPEIVRDVKPVIAKYHDERKALRANHDRLLAEWKSLSDQLDQRRGGGRRAAI